MIHQAQTAPKDHKDAAPALPLYPSQEFIRNSHSPTHSGLTLIELLVVVVILTTLVAGVVPLFSPNNDTRKIREASRGLHAYITLAQAKAARSGRPAGIAFQESTIGSGVALEVFQLEVPKGFSGFSEESRCSVSTGFGQYGSGGNGGIRFVNQYNGALLYGLSFELADGNNSADPFPPRMFRIGDIVDVEGNLFMIVDDNRNLVKGYPVSAPLSEQTAYLEPPSPNDPILCIWINQTGQLISPRLKTYKIIRQPVNSSESPYQLPSGIAIDLQGSVTEGNDLGIRFPAGESLFMPEVNNTVGIMFASTGSVSSVLLNGNELTNVSRILLLLGRVENGGLTANTWVTTANGTDEELEQKQSEINWLNQDSRWLAITTRSGRSVVDENAFVDTRDGVTDVDGDNVTFNADADEQIEAAHAFIQSMRRGGGG